MTDLVRYCPSCNTERPVAEISCEGEVKGAPCHWGLLEVPITASGWRPTVVVPAEPPPGTPDATTHHCANGHILGAGDLICGVCGADAAVGGEQSSPVPESALETVIAGWHVLRDIRSTAERRDRYLVEEGAGGRRAILTVSALLTTSFP